MKQHGMLRLRELSTSHSFISFFIIILTLVAYIVYDEPNIAMWFGFGVAGYSAIANDSIQTLGTFLSSNSKLSWLWLSLFIGGILLLILFSGWYINSGDIAFDRLHAIPQPKTFSFLMLFSPIILVLLTYLRMPVSTTFLLLCMFSSRIVIKKMLLKTLLGYSVALGVGTLFFFILMYCFKEFHVKKNFNEKLWRTLQFLSTGYLWAAWIMHDTANIAVFLPRHLSLTQVSMASLYLFAIVLLIMRLRGGRIQRVVTEKSSVTDLRSATIIDFILACILIFFKELSHIPMSTTWVFLGLLAGREIAFRATRSSKRSKKEVLLLIFKDVARAGFGLIVSLGFAIFA